jgi:hypothetical protein
MKIRAPMKRTAGWIQGIILQNSRTSKQATSIRTACSTLAREIDNRYRKMPKRRKVKRVGSSQQVGRSCSGGLLCLHLLGGLLLLAVLRLVVLVLVLRVFLLLCGGFGHELLESHEVTLFFGISCGLV